jgi:hypothetical protein
MDYKDLFKQDPLNKDSGIKRISEQEYIPETENYKNRPKHLNDNFEIKSNDISISDSETKDAQKKLERAISFLDGDVQVLNALTQLVEAYTEKKDSYYNEVGKPPEKYPEFSKGVNKSIISAQINNQPMDPNTLRMRLLSAIKGKSPDQVINYLKSNTTIFNATVDMIMYLLESPLANSFFSKYVSEFQSEHSNSNIVNQNIMTPVAGTKKLERIGSAPVEEVSILNEIRSKERALKEGMTQEDIRLADEAIDRVFGFSNEGKGFRKKF